MFVGKKPWLHKEHDLQNHKIWTPNLDTKVYKKKSDTITNSLMDTNLALMEWTTCGATNENSHNMVLQLLAKDLTVESHTYTKFEQQVQDVILVEK